MITNDQFVDQWPRSTDPALNEIAQRLWFTYDDLRQHKLTGRFAPTPQLREYFDRCALFLDLDRPYPWPQLCPSAWARWLLLMGTLGLWWILEWLLGLNQVPDGDYYPFASRNDWLSAKAEAQKP